jgi:subtilisin family serine protease
VRISRIAVSVVAFAWWASCAAVAVAAPDVVIVRFEPGVGAAQRAAIRDETGTAFERTLPLSGMQLLTVEPGRSVTAARQALEREDGVLYAEPNATRRAFLRPNDPYFPLLWAMENTGQSIRDVAGTADSDTDAGDAWDANIGGGVVVAVIDSGVEGDHPDLAPNGWRNAGESGLGRESNGLDDDLNGRIDDWRGWDFIGADNNPADENGHGTHVAGTIGARRGNALGVAGVADGSRLMALRVLDAQGSGTVANVIQAYTYASQEGAEVVNLSLGSDTASRAERDAIAAFPEMLFVAAAGNGGADGIGDDNDLDPQFPCAYLLPNVVCVAASDNRDRLAGFSNYGKLSVHLAAPGVSIASTWPGGGYGWASGTSMAAPHVAGAAALLWAADPGASVSDVKSALLGGVDAGQEFSARTVTGGRLNVLSSLRMVADVTFAQPAPAPPPSTSAGSAGSSSPGTGAPAGQATVGDRVPPRLSVRVARRQRLGRVLRRGMAVRVSCSESCSVRLRLRAGRRLLAATAPASIDAGARRRIVARIRRAARAGLRAGRQATLVVRATDRSGNSHVLSARILLRR